MSAPRPELSADLRELLRPLLEENARLASVVPGPDGGLVLELEPDPLKALDRGALERFTWHVLGDLRGALVAQRRAESAIRRAKVTGWIERLLLVVVGGALLAAGEALLRLALAAGLLP